MKRERHEEEWTQSEEGGKRRQEIRVKKRAEGGKNKGVGEKEEEGVRGRNRESEG